MESAENKMLLFMQLEKFIKNKKPDIVILQPNSPELKYKDLEKALIFLIKTLSWCKKRIYIYQQR